MLEFWDEYATVFKGSLATAGIAALAICAAVYCVLRALRLLRLRGPHTWRSDLDPLAWIGPSVFLLVFAPAVMLGIMASDLCATTDSVEFPAPDGKHKLVVYNFDCGATTDFSLIVSLLDADRRLPKHKALRRLYSHYHQLPIASGSAANFEVIWQDSRHAVVKVKGFDGTPLAEQDGVSVRFEKLE